MKVNSDRVVVVVDVDGTLVKRYNGLNTSGCISVKNPYDNKVYNYEVHTEHVELIKQYHGRGFFIRVWSANGAGHAESVIRALSLIDYVHDVDTKPMKFLDDKTDPAAIVGSHVFIPKEGWAVS